MCRILVLKTACPKIRQAAKTIYSLILSLLPLDYKQHSAPHYGDGDYYY